MTTIIITIVLWAVMGITFWLMQRMEDKLRRLRYDLGYLDGARGAEPDPECAYNPDALRAEGGDQ